MKIPGDKSATAGAMLERCRGIPSIAGAALVRGRAGPTEWMSRDTAMGVASNVEIGEIAATYLPARDVSSGLARGEG